MSKGDKEDANVLSTLKGGFHIMIWFGLENASTKHDIIILAAMRKFEMLSLCAKRYALLVKTEVFVTPHITLFTGMNCKQLLAARPTVLR